MAVIGEIMAREVLSVTADVSLADAARQMHTRRVGAVAVLDGDRLIGILTERDVLRAVATGKVDGPVSESMTHGPDTVEPSETTGHAAALMIHGGFRHLPVVDQSGLVGMISIRDLMRLHLADESPRGA